MNYPQQQYNKLITGLKVLMLHHNILTTEVLQDTSNEALLHDLHFRVYVQYDYTDNNANVIFVDGKRLLTEDNSFQLYPNRCNDSHIITAMKKAFKELATYTNIVVSTANIVNESTDSNTPDVNGNVNCFNCVDCYNCVNCSNCVNCHDCYNCYDCRNITVGLIDVCDMVCNIDPLPLVTPLPLQITTIEQAKEYIKTLRLNNELYHFDDSASSVFGTECNNKPKLHLDTCKHMDNLVLQIKSFNGFDCFNYMGELDDRDKLFTYVHISSGTVNNTNAHGILSSTKGELESTTGELLHDYLFLAVIGSVWANNDITLLCVGN